MRPWLLQHPSDTAVGMMLLVSSENLLLIFVALELTSLPLYALTAFNKGDVDAIADCVTDDFEWRLNAGGIDLNRDWGTFSQPETTALSQWIVAAAGGRRVVSMMDFHSTDKTVIYAPPLEKIGRAHV